MASSQGKRKKKEKKTWRSSGRLQPKARARCCDASVHPSENFQPAPEARGTSSAVQLSGAGFGYRSCNDLIRFFRWILVCHPCHRSLALNGRKGGVLRRDDVLGCIKIVLFSRCSIRFNQFASPCLPALPNMSYSKFWPKGGLPGILHHYVRCPLCRWSWM